MGASDPPATVKELKVKSGKGFTARAQEKFLTFYERLDSVGPFMGEARLHTQGKNLISIRFPPYLWAPEMR